MTKLIPYTPDKRNNAVQMVAAFFADHFTISEREQVTVTPARLQAAEEDLDDWLAKDEAVLFFIEEDGTEAGLILLATHGGTVVWIENLYVKPELRRRGIATRAIRLAEDYAREVMHAPAVNLDVIPQNIDAIRLYHSLGYDTLQMVTLRKSLNDDKRERPTDLLGFTFKI